MKKFIYIVIALFFAISSQAQLKEIDLKKRDLSDYNFEMNVSSLNTNLNSRGKNKSLQYSPMTALSQTSFSDYLQATMNDNRPIWIEGVIDGSSTRDLQTATFEYLLEAKDMMGISDPLNEFVVTSTVLDENNNRHVKMQQMYKGLPVYGKEVILHESRGQFSGLNGNFSTTPTIENIKPSITPAQAKVTILSDLGEKIKPIDTTLPGHADVKQWTEDLVLLPVDNGSSIKLVYHYTVYVNIIDRREYFIDAHTKDIVNKHQSICKLHNHDNWLSNVAEDDIVKEDRIDHTNKSSKINGPETANAKDLFNHTITINTYKQSSNYYMIDASRSMFNTGSNMPDEPKGCIWTIDAFNTNPKNSNFSYDHVKSNNNGWSGDNGAVSAHSNGGKAYEYYRSTHGRNSIDGKKGNIISLVNIADEDGSNLGNAFWNGQAMFYGNGDNAFKPLARALDVAGHELTHGVVQSTANLVYQGEAGAINESMADVFGAMIDRDDWLIGEDVVKTNNFPSGALRSLIDPHNGQSQGDYGHGFQPKHISEKYTGSQDNGGVHLNSGIANHAFYQFAKVVGKSKAEKVYYKALSQYLTKSSQFVDLRIAVVRSAKELYGTTEENAAKNAFQAVGIGAGAGGDYETDIESNPGDEFLVVLDKDKTKLILLDKNKNRIADPFTDIVPLSKPSISDNGASIVLVGKDKKIYHISIDWVKKEWSTEVIQSEPIWRNVVVSKDAVRIAALTDNIENQIRIYDFGVQTWNNFELYNPTYTEGVSTGDVQFADAMEFDPTGEWIMYDAKSEITSNSGGSISYWDIGFLNVWDNKFEGWGLGQVEKLFSSLPEDVSVGNPTYSKNSPYIIALDYIKNSDITVVGANIETNTVGTIATDLFKPGYPNYGFNDGKVIYDGDLGSFSDLYVTSVKDNKIDQSGNPGGDIYESSVRWGVFFRNGSRDLSATESIVKNDNLALNILPNPVRNQLNISLNSKWIGAGIIRIVNIDGTVVKTETVAIKLGDNTWSFDVSMIHTGNYIVQLNMEQGNVNQKMIIVD